MTIHTVLNEYEHLYFFVLMFNYDSNCACRSLKASDEVSRYPRTAVTERSSAFASEETPECSTLFSICMRIACSICISSLFSCVPLFRPPSPPAVASAAQVPHHLPLYSHQRSPLSVRHQLRISFQCPGLLSDLAPCLHMTDACLACVWGAS